MKSSKASSDKEDEYMSSRLEKIKGCLRLARNNDNLNEAEAAMQMAQRLALKEGIDLDNLEDQEEQKLNVTHHVVPQKTKTAPTWRCLMATIIANNFRVKCVRVKTSEDSSHIKIIGTEQDVEVWKVMFDYAETCLDIFFKRYLKEKKYQGTVVNRHDSLIMRNSYVEGFLNGIREALDKNVECYALSLTLPVPVQEELDKLHLTTSRVNKPQMDPEDTESRHRGYEDGRAAGDRNRLEE